MHKACFALILALTFTSTLSSYAAAGHAIGHYFRNINRPHYNAHRTIDTVCLNAVAGVNTAISQLLFDVRVQNNLMIIYADLDQLDESSYYLTRTCHSRSLVLVNLQPDQQEQTPNLACYQLMRIVGTMLEPDVFGHDYQKGMELSVAALDAGRELGNECNIVLTPAQVGDAVNEEELSLQQGYGESGEAELYLEEAEVTEMSFDIRILASNTDDESEDDWKSDDESIGTNGDTDDDGVSDDDADDSDDNDAEFSWDPKKGFRIKISKSKDESDGDYIISYDPSKGGFSIRPATSDDEDANEEEADSVEERSNEEWDNNEQEQDLLAPITRLYTYGWHSGDHDGNKFVVF